MVSCQKGPTRHAYAWQIGPFGRIPSNCSGMIVMPYESHTEPEHKMSASIMARPYMVMQLISPGPPLV